MTEGKKDTFSEEGRVLVEKIKTNLINQPITKAWLFGSFSRGEERQDSDIDLLVEYDKSKRMGLFAIAKIMIDLEKVTGRSVDIVENGCLIPSAEYSANIDKVLIYERAE